MIPADELTAMQATIATLLPDSCSILTPTIVSNGSGGTTTTWGTATASCRLDMLSGNESLSAGAIQSFQRGVMTLPTSATVTPTCKLVHGGITYNVISCDPDKSWPTCKRAIVEKTH
jgi:hypothetical protein